MSILSTSETEVVEKRFREEEHVVLAHCILNMNTRAPGISVWKGAIIPLMEALGSIKDKIHQLPCPEEHYIGSRRWWFVKEQYDSSLYRERSYMIGESYSYLLREEGASTAVVIGLGISPSCGVREVQSDPTWGGRPREVDISKNIADGKGVFMEEIEKAFFENGVKPRMIDVSPALIYPGRRVDTTRRYPRDPLESVHEICGFIGIECSFKYPKEEILKIAVLNTDLRAHKNLVVPRSLFISDYEHMVEKAYDGYGFIVIENFSFNKRFSDFMSSVYAQQLSNQLRMGERIDFYLGASPEEEFLENILENMEYRPNNKNFKLVTEV